MGCSGCSRSGEKRSRAHAPAHLEHVPVEGQVVDQHEDDVIGSQSGLVELAHLPAPRVSHRQPHDEKDDRLQDKTDEPDDEGGAVLQHLGSPCAKQHGVNVRESPHAVSWANTCSITSSMGGSSTVRSTTGRSVRMRPVTAAVSPFGTSSVTRAPSLSTTSP